MLFFLEVKVLHKEKGRENPGDKGEDKRNASERKLE